MPHAGGARRARKPAPQPPPSALCRAVIESPARKKAGGWAAALAVRARVRRRRSMAVVLLSVAVVVAGLELALSMVSFGAEWLCLSRNPRGDEGWSEGKCAGNFSATGRREPGMVGAAAETGCHAAALLSCIRLGKSFWIPHLSGGPPGRRTRRDDYLYIDRSSPLQHLLRARAPSGKG